MSLLSERKEDTLCTESHHTAVCQRDHGNLSEGLEEAIHLIVLSFQSTEITCQQLGQLFQTGIWRNETELKKKTLFTYAFKFKPYNRVGSQPL